MNRNTFVFSKTNRRNKIICLALSSALFIAPSYLFAQSANIQEVQELVEQWVLIEQEETALVIDWQNQQQIMQQHMRLLKEEEEQLQNIVSDNTSDMDEVTARRLSLLELQNSMEDDQKELEIALEIALGQINSLHAQLPPPLATAWQERLNMLAIKTENAETSNSNEKLQALLEMLTQLQDFQQRISLNEDTIITPDGIEVLVQQVYLGVSHAWYVSADGLYSGYGQSRPEGWVWLDSPVVNPETVQQAITMLERNVDIELLELPIVLQSPPLQATSEAIL